MLYNITSDATFWTGLVIFLIPVIIGLFTIKKLFFKIIFGFILLVAYVLNERYQQYTISDEKLKKIIVSQLKRVDALKVLNPDQNLRANIFCVGIKDHRIIYQYNMDHDLDRDLALPVNMGITGYAISTKESYIDQRDTFKIKHSLWGLTPKILPFVRKDLEWICAIPILDKNEDVVLALSIDGNIKSSELQYREIRKFAENLAADLRPTLEIRFPILRSE